MKRDGIHRLQVVKQRSPWGASTLHWHVHWRDGFNEIAFTLESVNVECMTVWEFGLRWLPFWRKATEPEPTRGFLRYLDELEQLLLDIPNDFSVGDPVQVKLHTGPASEALNAPAKLGSRVLPAYRFVFTDEHGEWRSQPLFCGPLHLENMDEMREYMEDAIRFAHLDGVNVHNATLHCECSPETLTIS